MRFQALIEAVLGIIFLACPHSTRTDEATSRLYSLLQYLDTTDSIRLKISHDDLVSLANASRQFEEIGVQVPILSAFETKETKLKAPFWKPGREIVSSQRT